MSKKYKLKADTLEKMNTYQAYKQKVQAWYYPQPEIHINGKGDFTISAKHKSRCDAYLYDDCKMSAEFVFLPKAKISDEDKLRFKQEHNQTKHYYSLGIPNPHWYPVGVLVAKRTADLAITYCQNDYFAKVTKIFYFSKSEWDALPVLNIPAGFETTTPKKH